MQADQLRDRIVTLRRIKARDLQDHNFNWRSHPQFQQDALAAVIRDVGIASALLVYESARQGGLTLLDGHLRKDTHPDFEWPCLMLDVNDAEADEILATHDPLAAMAIADSERLGQLLHGVQSGEAAVQQMLSELAASNTVVPPQVRVPDGQPPPEPCAYHVVEIQCSTAQLTTIQPILDTWEADGLTIHVS